MVRSFVTPNPFLRVLVIGLSFSTCLSWQAAVEAQDHSAKPSRRFAPRGASDATEVASDLQFNVVTVDGVFYVFEAAALPDRPKEPRRYLAFWKGFAESRLFTYGRSLFTVDDVAEAVEALARDLGEDAASIASARSDLSIAWEQVRGQEIGEAGWTVATRNGVLRLTGHPVPADPTGAEIPDVEFACPPPESRLPPGEPRQPGDSRGPTRLSNPVEIRRPVETPEDLLLRLEGWVACGGCTNSICIGGCNDGNSCTIDACHCGACQYWPNPQGCPDDGNPCTNDVCANGLCTHPPANGARCPDDGNECTDDICNNLVCTHPANQRPCSDDGDLCTDDYCQNGVCVHSSPLRCDDGNPCTWDYCTGNFVKPVCGYVPMTGPPCDDGIPCTINDHCVNGSCVGSPNCNDGDSCTDDFCNGSCQHIPKNCNDGNLCTVDLGCLPNQGCQYAPVDCDDGNPCTTDGPCSPSQGCQYQWRNCDDGDPCTADSCADGACVHGHPDCEAAEDPCNPTPVVNYNSRCTDCTVTITVAPTLWINCDDDDGNGVSDFQQAGPVAGENDLVPASLSWTAGCAQVAIEGEIVKWRLVEGQGNRTYRAYRNPDKTQPVDSFGDYHLWPPPATIWLEGIAPTEQCPTRIVLWVAAAYASGSVHCVYCGYEGQRMAVDGPVLTWEKLDPGSPDLDECPNNGGLRIFPDKLSPIDQAPTIRQQVRLTAKLDPPQANVIIYFKVFDVDDPFDQLNPTMPDVGLIDSNPASGPDNRGAETVTLPWSASAPTDTDGQASVTFTVSMQPGNNYRAVASRVSTAVAQITQSEADAMNSRNPVSPGAPVRGCFDPLIWSPMLTVWRKLHVEIDSMGAEPTSISGRMPDWDDVLIMSGTSSTTSTCLTVRSTLFGQGGLASDEPYHYEYGTLSIPGITTPEVVLSTGISGFDAFLDIQPVLTAQEIATAIDSTARLVDDDPPSGQLPRTFDIEADTFVSRAYEAAYIDVVQLTPEANPNTSVPFFLELSDTDLLLGNGYDNAQDVWSSNQYWASLVVFSFQPSRAADHDADPFTGVGNIGPSQTPQYDPKADYGITVEDDDNASIIFLEVIRDTGHRADKTISVTIAHEIGHSCGPNISPTTEHQEYGLMDEIPTIHTASFTAPTLLRFRSFAKW